MRRGFLVIVGIILIVGVVVLMWWLPAYREDQLNKRIAAIEAMEDLTAKKEAALDFLLMNHMSDRELLLRALDAAVDAHRDDEDKMDLVELFQGLYDENLTPWLHYRIMARLDRGLIEYGTEESVARAEALARDLLEAGNAPMETYHWMVYFHRNSEMTNPELTLRVALAAEKATDRIEYGAWQQLLNMAYGRLLHKVNDEQGLEAALSKADVLASQTELPKAHAALQSCIYELAIEENEGRAIEAAQALAEMEGLTDSEPLNQVAYDMAERGLAPDIAVTLGERALSLASSRYDSTLVLDTVGWAHYAAGDHAAAADYLERALELMDETPTMDNDTVQHLLTAYDTGDMNDAAIGLLAVIAARSMDADDPARERLATLLVERDGNAEAMETLMSEHRYDGVEAAPPFSLSDRSGATFSLEDHRGDILVLAFWSHG